MLKAMRTASVVLLLVSASCDRSDPAPAASAPAATASSSAASSKQDAPAQACGPARASELEALLVDGCTDASFGDTRPLAPATWPATHRGSLGAPVIVVTSKGAELYGRALAIDELPRELAQARQWGDPQGPAFGLAIHGAAKLGDVQPILAALVEAQATEGVLFFASATLPRTPKAADPELYARLSAKIEALEVSDRAVTLAREVETLIAPCAPLEAAFSSVAADDPSTGCPRLMKAAAQGIVACECPSWTPELVAWLQVVSGPADAPRSHADTVTIDPTRSAAVDPQATWASFVARRSAPIEALWFGG